LTALELLEPRLIIDPIIGSNLLHVFSANTGAKSLVLA
jgi:hypothetical protein